MQKKTAQIAFLIMLATTISRCIGFFREITIGSVLGTSYIADAYLVSLSVPDIIFANITGSIATTFIPMYIRKKENQGDKESMYFTNNLINIVSIISIFISVISIIFAEQIIGLIAGGFDEKTLEMATAVSRITFITITFMGINNILTGYLNSNNKFILPALIGIPNSIIIIISLLLYEKFGIMGVSYATLLGTLVQTILIFLQSNFTGYKFKPTININDQTVKEILILALPVFIGSSIGQINAFIDRMLASGLPQGSIAALNFANKLNYFVFGITSVAIATVIYPLLSKLGINKDRGAYKELFSKSFSIVTILLFPITVAACVLNEPVVRLLFERGAFDSRSTNLTSSALFYYSLSMLFMGYNDIVRRAFYSIQDTKTPLINSMISVCIHICLNLILVRYMAHNGLALASSIANIVTTFLLVFSLKRKIGAIGGGKILITIIKSGIASFSMGIVIKFIYLYLASSFDSGALATQSLIFIVITLSGAITYLLILFVFKTEELKWIINLLTSRRKSNS